MRPRIATLMTEEAHETICDAYTYGYPLVLMDITRQLMTDVTSAGDQRAPLNQFAHSTRLSRSDAHPDPTMLTSTAWLNLTKEPVVLSLPDMDDRYYTMQVIDGWNNVCASLGSRTSGNRKAHIAIVGPHWSGALPDGVQTIEASTSIAWLIGRIETSGKRSLPAVHAIQQRFTLTPLHAWGRRNDRTMPQAQTPRGLDRRVTPAERVSKMNASEFFSRLNTLMIENPPSAWEAPALYRFLEIGVGPGLPFDLSDDAMAARSVDGSARTALARIVVEAKKPSGRRVNGWWTPSPAVRNDVDYMRRAVVALVDPGADRSEDGVYFRADTDADGHLLSGAERYTLRITRQGTSPVLGRWSIALYNTRQGVVQNAMDRHAIGHHDPVTVNSDTSVNVHIQHEPPGADTQSNWLPAPPDHFVLMLRLYSPGPEILNDTAWMPPAVERV